MIRLLAPTTIASADEGGTLIVEMDRAVFHALRAGVEVAFEDLDSVPAEHSDSAHDLWRFFVEGTETR